MPLSSLSVSLSSYYDVDSDNKCFDGSINSICHSSLNVPYSSQHATLTITTSSSIKIANIKVYNRLDCCGGRIRNAKISVSVGSSLVWSDRFDNSDGHDVYDFITTSNVTAATSSNQCITTASLPAPTQVCAECQEGVTCTLTCSVGR